MKFKFIILLLIFLTGISGINAHGVDVTEDVMVITNETTAIQTKKIVDSLNLNITVYKFASDSEVRHQLEHAKTNPNKRILALAYQDTVNEFLKSNKNLSSRVFVVNGESELDIKEGLIKLNESANTVNEDRDIDYTTIILVIVIVGLITGIGIFLLKR